MATESVETNEHNPEEVGLAEVKKRTISGVIALTFRTLVLQIVGLVAYGVYSALFTPGDIGTYTLVLSVRNFLSYFSDIGLAGALIQKKGLNLAYKRINLKRHKQLFYIFAALYVLVFLQTVIYTFK